MLSLAGHEGVALLDGSCARRFPPDDELIILSAPRDYWQGSLEMAGIADLSFLSRHVNRLCQDRYLANLIRRMYFERLTDVPEAEASTRLSSVVLVVTFLDIHLAANHDTFGARLHPAELEVVLRRMEADLGEALRVEDLARAVALSPSRFSRAFKKTMKLTPYQYLLRRRLQRARDMLSWTEEPLASIAVECGFCSQAHLTRLFKRSYGVPPGRYRRDLQPSG
ncbi:MAG: AraC family transcriptional regulator [Myxococcota bacterium]